MDVCPLCNGLESVSFPCPNCQSSMEDLGRLTDYFDDYSPYLDIDMAKMVDGDENTLEGHQCLHYFYCTNCRHEEIKGIEE